MNRALVEQVVNAVLYEGYILYPYRASSKKNQVQRFTFGRVYPKEYSAAQNGAEPCAMQSEFLVRNESKDAIAKISVRFLHPLVREVGALSTPITELPTGQEPDFQLVPQLRLEGKLYQTWQEAVERAVELPAMSLGAAAHFAHHFHFPSARALEPIRNNDGRIAGVFLRRQERIEGVVEITFEPVDQVVVKIRVRVVNRTPVPPAELEDQDAIVMRSLASTHTILEAQGGECLSLLDPPPAYAKAAAACSNIGCWPVLVGDDQKGGRDTMLSSPIILYDYPKIAPESAGDLFDGAEIDEILTLRIMTMTDEEKREMRGVDDHARRILERTEMLPDDHLLKMHGAMRSVPAPQPNEFFNPTKRLESVIVEGVELRAGDKVRIWPKKRAGIMDMALEGKVATIEALEEDVEKQVTNDETRRRPLRHSSFGFNSGFVILVSSFPQTQ